MADIREDDYLSSLTGSQMDAALLDMTEHNSEAWAVGERNGFAVSEFDETYENNAKYYAEQAAKVVPTSGVPAIRYDVDQSRILSDTEHETSAYNVFGKPIGVMQTFLNKISKHSYLAKIKKLTGKSAVINQLVKNGNFASVADWNLNSVTYTVSGNVGTVVFSSTNNSNLTQAIQIVNGHKYYWSGAIKSSVSNAIYTDNLGTLVSSNSDNTWHYGEKILVPTFDGSRQLRVYGYAEGSAQVQNIMWIDLTAIFGVGSEPSTVDSLKSAWLAKFGYPLPNYIPYNSGSIVDTDIKGFGSTGKNVLSVNNKTLTTNYELLPCKLISGETYHISGQASYATTLRIPLKNGGYQYLEMPIGKTFTANDDADYISFYLASSSLTITDLQIEVGTTATPYEPYNPYFRNFPIVLRSAGSVADTVEDTGNGYKVTRRVGSVDLGTLNWTYIAAVNMFYTSFSGHARVAFGVGALPNGICAKYTPAPPETRIDKTWKFTNDSDNLYIVDSAYTDATAFKTAMNGVYLNYELATPITEYHSYNLTYPVTENGTEYFDSPISVPCEIEYGIDALTDIAKGVVTSPTDLTMADLASKRFSNPNLLDNWWFGKGVINQRGITTATSNDSYMIDRWKAYRSGVTLSDNGISLPSSNGFRQTIEESLKDNIIGKTATVSALVDGVLHSTTFDVKAEYMYPMIGNSGLRLDFNLNGTNKLFLIYNTSSATKVIKAVKLELGSVSTLANDSAPDYRDELRKSQYYFVALSGKTGVLFTASALTTTILDAFIPYEMRDVDPTVTWANLTTYEGLAITNVAGYKRGFGEQIRLNVSGATVGKVYHIVATNGSAPKLWVSADL